MTGGRLRPDPQPCSGTPHPGPWTGICPETGNEINRSYQNNPSGLGLVNIQQPAFSLRLRPSPAQRGDCACVAGAPLCRHTCAPGKQRAVMASSAASSVRPPRPKKEPQALVIPKNAAEEQKLKLERLMKNPVRQGAGSTVTPESLLFRLLCEPASPPPPPPNSGTEYPNPQRQSLGRSRLSRSQLPSALHLEPSQDEGAVERLPFSKNFSSLTFCEQKRYTGKIEPAD